MTLISHEKKSTKCDKESETTMPWLKIWLLQSTPSQGPGIHTNTKQARNSSTSRQGAAPKKPNWSKYLAIL
jgi:hypothetical protein